VDEAPRGLTVYGQEKDNATYALARMNMILHDNPTAEIWHDNTLSAPYFKGDDNRLKRFDFAVANPPFSDKAWMTGFKPDEDEYNRFEHGIPPAKNGDYAFLLHFIASLKSTGKGAIILPHGVLFRGNKEADIRRKLIEHGYIKGIIGLPANLFYGTGIPACILVIDKENVKHRTGIFMIDASKGFLKDGNKNRLRAQDIHRIVSVFNNQTEIDGYSRMVPTYEISDTANDYNLNIPRYIDNSEPEDLHDLDAHLNGGIPDTDIDALKPYWDQFPTLRQELFAANGRPGYSDPQVDAQQVKQLILSHNEFTDYQQRITAVYERWQNTHAPLLNGIDDSTKPRDIIDALSENLLTQFDDVPLLDPYDVYQKLMDYWEDVMQDDVYLITTDGWVKASQPRDIIQEKNLKETPDLTIKKKKYKMDLIPPSLIVARYFADEQTEIDALQTVLESADMALAEYIEEHTGEEGLLSEVVNDSGNVTKTSVNARIKELTPNLMTRNETQDNDEEQEALEQCLSLIDAKAKADKTVKDAQLALDEQVLARYGTLTKVEIKQLVIDDKWFATIQTAVTDEVQRLTQKLTERVKELEERYVQPLPELERKVAVYSTRVREHLKKIDAIGHNKFTGESLLTGKTRLPGFSGEWETMKLGEVADCLDNVRIPLNETQRANMQGPYPYCGANGVLDYVNDYVLDDDVILIAEDGGYFDEFLTRPIAYRMSGKIWVNNHAHVLKAKPDYDQGFLYYSLVHKNIMPYLSGGTRAKLNKFEMFKIEINVPDDIGEQRAIAAVLSDMDAEIIALEQHRDKTIAIKQGMMQQLLTGKVRLSESRICTDNTD
ncbi:N-6 DNA methylase, partial [Candidatus Poribacteria bacterium]|nr:N-6 DNA methylase [Candidatus Poribacteria bacterium]MYB65722.1 N-6 DNA methylase [Candidatus Poribacteria bacterium]